MGCSRAGSRRVNRVARAPPGASGTAAATPWRGPARAGRRWVGRGTTPARASPPREGPREVPLGLDALGQDEGPAPLGVGVDRAHHLRDVWGGRTVREAHVHLDDVGPEQGEERPGRRLDADVVQCDRPTSPARGPPRTGPPGSPAAPQVLGPGPRAHDLPRRQVHDRLEDAADAAREQHGGEVGRRRAREARGAGQGRRHARRETGPARSSTWTCLWIAGSDRPRCSASRLMVLGWRRGGGPSRAGAGWPARRGRRRGDPGP